jgi:hypothetical protein
MLHYTYTAPKKKRQNKLPLPANPARLIKKSSETRS